MSTKTENKPALSYETATGIIEFTLKSDIMFRYVMQRSNAALTGLVCALKGISPSDVKELRVENPIDLNNAAKETIMDLKLTLNNDEIMNIELQVYPDQNWIPRSILYLCRAYDSIGKSENYALLKPTTLYCITDRNLIPNALPEFYAKYKLINTENHTLYTDKIGINVLQLNHTELATQKDIDNNLVYWAELFKATTWEEFKTLAKDNPSIKEVGTMIFELNYDNQAKELLEGQRRYREMMNSQYSYGVIDTKKEMQPIIDNLENENSSLKGKNSNLIGENNDLNDENERLKALLKEHGISDK
ncbi:MAG: Rpn family recombination-promoting nuclease/putative transposase [Butyrivibrio sp.]|nr:Rpn family recombination-promoting nuclease/putative transposase [Butyrivibrio sp.]